MNVNGVRRDLGGMDDAGITDYFKRCITENKILFYTGGEGNSLLIDEKYWGFIEGCGFAQVSVGCVGGVDEGYKFNKLMLDYTYENSLDAEGRRRDLTGLSDKELFEYFNRCKDLNLIFLYTGGYTNDILMADDGGYDIAKGLVARGLTKVSLGCDGGCDEGFKFNRLMLDYIKKTNYEPRDSGV